MERRRRRGNSAVELQETASEVRKITLQQLCYSYIAEIVQYRLT